MSLDSVFMSAIVKKKKKNKKEERKEKEIFFFLLWFALQLFLMIAKRSRESFTNTDMY